VIFVRRRWYNHKISAAATPASKRNREEVAKPVISIPVNTITLEDPVEYRNDGADLLRGLAPLFA
jgi:hypothetical protein